MRKILEVIKVVGLGSFYGAYILTGLTRFTGLSLVGAWRSRVELGDFAKVAVEGLTVLCQNFWGRVEGMWDFWYNKNVDWATIQEG